MTVQRSLAIGSSVLWLTAVLCCASAHAQPIEENKVAPSAQEAEARGAFEAGRDAYEHGLFAQALTHFERAYALSRLPQLLFNIGRAADSDSRAARAIAAYSSYLEAFPAADNVAFVKARLAKLRTAPVVARRPPAKRPVQVQHRSLTPAVLTLGALSLASAGMFVGYALAAQRGYDRCDGPRFCSDREFSDAYRRRVYIADGFGAAALALGTTASVLFFVGRARDKRASLPVDLRVAVAPGHGKVVLHGTF